MFAFGAFNNASKVNAPCHARPSVLRPVRVPVIQWMRNERTRRKPEHVSHL